MATPYFQFSKNDYRYNSINIDNQVSGGSIVLNELHKSLYVYTLTIDLDKVGVDNNIFDGRSTEIAKDLKAERVKSLLKAIKFLVGDVKGRSENLSPVFVIGGIYQNKNAHFDNRVKLLSGSNSLDIDRVLDTIDIDEDIVSNTKVGYVSNTFDNDEDVKKRLNTISIREFYEV